MPSSAQTIASPANGPSGEDLKQSYVLCSSVRHLCTNLAKLAEEVRWLGVNTGMAAGRSTLPVRVFAEIAKQIARLSEGLGLLSEGLERDGRAMVTVTLRQLRLFGQVKQYQRARALGLSPSADERVREILAHQTAQLRDGQATVAAAARAARSQLRRGRQLCLRAWAIGVRLRSEAAMSSLDDESRFGSVCDELERAASLCEGYVQDLEQALLRVAEAYPPERPRDVATAA